MYLTAKGQTPQSFVDATVSQLTDCINKIPGLLFNQFINNVSDCYQSKNQTIYFTGIGKNIPALLKTAATMKSLGINAQVLDAVDAMHGDLGVIKEHDIIIAVSKSGNTEEVCRTLKYLQTLEFSFHIFGLSMADPNETVAFDKYTTHYQLPQAVELDQLNRVPTVSALMFQIVFDSLAMIICQKQGFTEEQFKINHPSGKIGEQFKSDQKKSSEKKSRNLLILAGGHGSRLAEYTGNNCYPKILISLGQETLLTRLLRSYSGIFDQLTLVVQDSNQKNILTSFLSIFHNDIKFQIIVYPKRDGTYNTLKHILSKYPDLVSNTFLHWSDVIVEKSNLLKLKSAILNCTTNLIITDNQPRHRLDFRNATVYQSKDQTGNIPGIFYFSDLSWILNQSIDLSEKETDFVHALADQLETKSFLPISSISLDILDVGDREKYIEFMKTVDLSARSFNNLEFTKNTVTKQARSERGKEIIANELDFYQFANPGNTLSCYPKILDVQTEKSGFTMERIQGKTVCETLNLSTDRTNKSIELLYQFKHSIYLLHSTMIIDDDRSYSTDIHHEYIETTKHRFKEIEYILPNVTCFTSENNSLKVSNFSELIQNIEKYLRTRKYFTSIIHGDPNGCNVMINNENQMVFIDPRGKFGKSKYQGNIDYDYAKFIYGIHAYDNFNLDQDFKFGYNSSMQTITCDMSKYGTNLQILLETTTKNQINQEYLRLLVGIIFIKLGAYISNNLSKSIVAVNYGNALATQALSRIESLEKNPK